MKVVQGLHPLATPMRITNEVCLSVCLSIYPVSIRFYYTCLQTYITSKRFHYHQ